MSPQDPVEEVSRTDREGGHTPGLDVRSTVIPGDDAGPATVLIVDDDPELVDATAAFLEKEADEIVTVTATSASDGLAVVDSREVHCIVSDFDMPEMDGLRFLAAVRQRDDSLPFVLFTGKGSEEIASTAISEGVSDYLQKGGPDQFALLATRVQTLVDKRQTEAALQLRVQAIEAAREGIAVLDDDGRYIYMNEAYAVMHGYDVPDLIGETWEVLSTDEEVEVFTTEIMPQLAESGDWRGSVTGIRRDGSRFPKDLSMAHMAGGGHVCVISDMTDYVTVSEETVAERVLQAHGMGAMLAEGDAITGANNEFLMLVRHSRETLLSLPLSALGDELVALVDRARETGHTQNGAVTLRAESGTTTAVECRVEVVEPEKDIVAVLAYRA
ncbi:response regulator [Haloarchaeobius sp. DYHT-AS-18]|uniref:PAS domain-containing response regulator n=1 Tax=Haloarchaeobius sp. DYHT-AS-18 TaxID=3446117 RepID=UPI003EC0AA93